LEDNSVKNSFTGVMAMNIKRVSVERKPVLPTGQPEISNYINGMFLFSILGFLAFCGIAWGLGSLQTSSSMPMPNSSALSTAVSTRS
jgi:hypothetical protein